MRRLKLILGWALGTGLVRGSLVRGSLLGVIACWPGSALAQSAVTPTIGIEVLRVPESNNKLTFTLALSAPSPVAVTGKVSATESTADTAASGRATPGAACQNGVDYIDLVDKAFRFEPGQQRLEFSLELCADQVFEEDESIVIAIDTGSLVGAACGIGLNNRCRAVPDILNDDVDQQLPLLRIADASVSEPTTGEANGQIEVKLTRRSSRETSFDFTAVANTARAAGQVPPPLVTVGGTAIVTDPVTCDQAFRGSKLAKPGLQNPNPIIKLRRDFVPVSGTLLIPANTLSVSIPVLICSDGLQEPAERIHVVISNAKQGASVLGIADGRGNLVIRANAAAPAAP